MTCKQRCVLVAFTPASPFYVGLGASPGYPVIEFQVLHPESVTNGIYILTHYTDFQRRSTTGSIDHRKRRVYVARATGPKQLKERPEAPNGNLMMLFT